MSKPKYTKETKNRANKSIFGFARAPKRQSGFSIVEAMVAITVLLISIAGPMTIAQKGLSTARISVDQITAFYLAQEAIEGIRHIRDSNILSERNWLSGLSVCLDGACTIDVTKNDEISACSGEGECPTLKYDSRTNLYGYDDRWEDSKFKRNMKIRQVGPNEISVEVSVSWATGFFTKDIVIKDHMLNWQ